MPRVSGSEGPGRVVRSESLVLECLVWKGDQGRIWKKAAVSLHLLEKGHCGHCVDGDTEMKLLICWQSITIHRGKGQWNGRKREICKGIFRNHGNKHSFL